MSVRYKIYPEYEVLFSSGVSHKIWIDEFKVKSTHEKVTSSDIRYAPLTEFGSATNVLFIKWPSVDMISFTGRRLFVTIDKADDGDDAIIAYRLLKKDRLELKNDEEYVLAVESGLLT